MIYNFVLVYLNTLNQKLKINKSKAKHTHPEPEKVIKTILTNFVEKMNHKHPF